MIAVVPYIISLGYLVLVIELVFFPVKSPGSTYRILIEKKVNLWVSITALFSNFLVICIILYPLANIFLKWQTLSTSYWMILIGMLFIGTARWLSFGAMIQLRGNRKTLHTNGFFKRTRNPNIDGTITFLIGMWFLMPSTVYFISLIFVFLYLNNRSKIEEEYLSEIFGEKYLKYKNSTPSSVYIWQLKNRMK